MAQPLTSDSLVPTATTTTAVIPASVAFPLVGAFIIHSISNRILHNSVKTRLKNGPSITMIRQARQLLENELSRKQQAVKNAIPPALLTVLIAFVLLWKIPIQRERFGSYAPSGTLLGVDFAMYCCFTCLDDIQDEVSPLGKPQTRDVVLLMFGSLVGIVMLLCGNKFYQIKAIAILVSVFVGKSADTAVWNVLGLVAIVLSTGFFLPLLFENETSDPPRAALLVILVVHTLVNCLYELVTVKHNPLRVPHWLIRVAEAQCFQFLQTWVLALIGVFPAAWMFRESLMFVSELALKVEHHSNNLRLVVKEGVSP